MCTEDSGAFCRLMQVLVALLQFHHSLQLTQQTLHAYNMYYCNIVQMTLEYQLTLTTLSRLVTVMAAGLAVSVVVLVLAAVSIVVLVVWWR